MVKEITNANDVRITVGTVGQVPVADFSISREEDTTTIHGVSHAEPRGYSHGNITYDISFTLEGEVTEVMNEVVQALDGGQSQEIKFVVTGDHYKWLVTGVNATNEEVSGTDGDVLEYSADAVATNLEREELGGSDL